MVAADPGARPRILVVGYRKFGQLMAAVAADFADRAEVRVVEYLMGSNEPVNELVDRHGVDVVISAGANAAYLAAALNVPVLSVEVSESDLLEALLKARDLGRRILLVTYGEPSPVLQPLARLADMDLDHRGYQTADEAREQFLLAQRGGCEVVVGASLVCELAERAGIPAILLYSRASCRAVLTRALERAQEAAVAPRPGTATRRRPEAPQRRLVFAAPEMRRIDALIGSYATVPGTVLIHGESGTGKELVARRLHREGPWAGGELVAVNCGAIPEELFESELFGYAEGAFTSSRRGGRRGLLELAQHGVVFLDEVGEMPPGQQAKLLRVLEERRFRALGSNREIALDVRFVAATNADLRERVRAGRFREDLFYRLNVFTLQLPPLRERCEDIPVITRYLLADYAQRYGVAVDTARLAARLEEPFARYRFPGNVRELENFVERVVVSAARLGSGEEFDAAFAQVLPELHAPAAAPSGALREREEHMIRDALARFGNDRTRAAEYLGISQTTLWRRLKSLEGKA